MIQPRSIETPESADLSRYHRQMLLPGIGEAGQRRLRGAAALLVGCGALGTVIAESLVRAGIGRLRIVDRDLVEITNLQRQTLFDENDVAEARPKAVAAHRRLTRINSEVQVEAVVADYSAANAEALAAECDVLIDGTDNFETRLLLNDVAVKRGVPYIYGGAVGTTGMMYVVVPQEGPCLRCILEEAPPPGTGPTCDTAGVLGPAAAIVANLEAAEAIKLLSGNLAAVSRKLWSFDLWSGEWRKLNVSGAYEPGRCVCCGQRRFEYLNGERGSRTFTLCGRNAVQVSAPAPGNSDGAIDLASLAKRLAPHGEVRQNEHLLRMELREGERAFQLTLFADGRALVHGTAEPAVARAIYSRYVGL